MKLTQNDLKCIWMLAGVVNYRLCEHEYGCENCELDRVLRGDHPENAPATRLAAGLATLQPVSVSLKAAHQMAQRYLMALVRNCQIHLDRDYHPSQLWTQIEADDILSVGIDHFVLKLVEPAAQIILPEVGKTYRAGQLIAYLTYKTQIFPFHAPVSGKVVVLNSEWPAVVPPHGFEDVWLFKMQSHGLQQEWTRDRNNSRSLEIYAQKLELLRQHLTQALAVQHPSPVGLTMADGGKLELELEKVLGEKNFIRFLNLLFQMK
jgi:glycine cleavage system H protein